MPDEMRLTGEEIQKSYWFVTHLRDIRKKIVIVWIIITAAIWLYVLAAFVGIYLLPLEQDKDFRQKMAVQSSAFSLPVQMTDPTVLSSGVIPASGETIDLYALVSNPYDSWWADIDYHFELGGSPLASRKDFILPKSQQYILQLAQHGDTNSQVRFIIDRIKWNYVSEYMKIVLMQRNRFATQNISYTPSSQTESARALPISSLRFDFVNNTPYSYWETLLPIVAKSGEQIVAASLIRLADIKREEIRPVEVRWFHSFLFPTSFEITPHANVLNPSSYRTH